MNEDELKSKIIEILNEDKIISVSNLVKELKYNEEEIVGALLELEDEDKIELIEVLPERFSFFEYLKSLDHALWFYLIIIGVVLTIFLTMVLPSNIMTDIARIAVGILFIAFFPGYSVVETLFPNRSELSSIERFALGVGLSIAIVPALGFILNYTVKIYLSTAVIATSIFTILFSVIALIRKYKLGKRNGLELKPYTR